MAVSPTSSRNERGKMASIIVEDLSPVKKKVTFEIPEEIVRQAIESQYMDIKKKAQIKGFRKGKAPLQIVRLYFKGKVEEGALQKVIEDTLEPGLKQENINPLSVLTIDPGTFEAGKPFRFSAEVEVAPIIPLANYKGMELKKPATNVSDEMLEQRLQRIRNANAKLVSIPTDRGAKTGDYLMVDVTAEVEGETVSALTVNDYHLEMGRDFYLPGFDVHLEGIKIDDKREIVIDFADDFPNKQLAGKQGRFQVICKEIKERVVPELDDEFARDLGTYNSLAELKDAVRRELEQEVKRAADFQVREQIKKHLLENHQFEVPNSLVEQKLKDMINEFLQMYASQGADPKKLVQSGALPTEKLRPAAEREAKLGLILKAIADKESIDATQEELDQEWEAIAQQFQMAADDVERFRQEKNEPSIVRDIVIERKTYRFLEENAVFVEATDASETEPSETLTEVE